MQQVELEALIDCELAPAMEAIGARAALIADRRVNEIVVMSGGVVSPDMAQRDGIRAAVAEQLTAKLREQVRSVANAFIANINQE